MAIHKSVLEKFHFTSELNLNTLKPLHKEIMRKNARTIILKKKQILYNQGSFPKGVYLLKQGKLKIYQQNYDGTKQILFIYREGELFGYRPILSNELHPVSAEALEECALTIFDKNDFLEMIDKSAEFSKQLLKSLSHEFTVLTYRLNAYAQKSIRQRIALAILILNQKYIREEQPEGYAEITLIRTDLANYVGTTLETLIRNLKILRTKKIIVTYGKTIRILDYEKLLEISSIG